MPADARIPVAPVAILPFSPTEPVPLVQVAEPRAVHPPSTAVHPFQAAGDPRRLAPIAWRAQALGVWLIRRLLFAPRERMEWLPWLRRVVPLSLGIGSIQFMSNADVVYVQSVFSADKTPLYMPAAMIGLALVTFTTPLASVMFPKVVRSAALTQSTRALQQALGATGLLGAAAALACTVLPELPLRIIYLSKPIYWAAAPLVPWFTWCLLPLVLANVLLSNLLARERFAVVPWASLVAVGYGIALSALKPRLLHLGDLTAFRTVIQTLGGFSLLLLAVAVLFTWREKKGPVVAAAP